MINYSYNILQKGKIIAVFLLLCVLFSTKSQAETQTLKTIPNKSASTESIDKQATNPQSQIVQVADIYVACKYYFSKILNTRENVSRKNICNGYFFGGASMLLSLQSEGVKTSTCIPLNTSTEEIIREFLDWAEKNPDKMKTPASQALLELFRNNYPCNEFNPNKNKVK